MRRERERERVRENERERETSLSSSSSYIGTNLFMRTPNLDGIKEQKCVISVLEPKSPKSRCQQDYILSKTCRVYYFVWAAKARCHRLGGLSTEIRCPLVQEAIF